MKTTHTILAILLTLALGRASHAQQPTQQVQVTESPAVPPTLNTELSMTTRLLLQTAQSASLSHSGMMLVIPTARMKSNQLKEIIEDMQIMGQIFRKKGSLVPPRTYRLRYGSDFGFDIMPGLNWHTGVYLQDFGVVFFMRTPQPLLPPDEPDEKVAKGKKDTLWEKTRQELSTPQDKALDLLNYHSSLMKKKQKPQPYDAESVQKLENELIESLKYAANIRHMQPNDRIILHVQGDPGQPQGQQGQLTIQAKWPDIKAYHAGKIDIDAFKQKVVKIMLITKDSSPKPRPTATPRSRSTSRPVQLRPSARRPTPEAPR